MIVSVIAAISKNGIIGRNGVIPWRSKEDMTFFKEKTIGHPIIMGRKTWDSLNAKPLKGRFNIVVTRNQELIGKRDEESEDGPLFVDSISTGIDVISDLTTECFIIGGEQIYREALDMGLVDRMYLNIMNQEVVGDAYFPYFERDQWLVDQSQVKYNDFTAFTYIKNEEQ